MIALTHITARYLKALADGGHNYAGRRALVRFKGDQLEFAALDGEEEAVGKLDEERHLGM